MNQPQNKFSKGSPSEIKKSTEKKRTVKLPMKPSDKTHKEAFEQLLDDAVLGVKKK
ncbi:MAG: hypothetical protein NTY41_13670 [Proteobacteria bacterium]|nr:hypothetical protein [Pseudomonadota bacterium]